MSSVLIAGTSKGISLDPALAFGRAGHKVTLAEMVGVLQRKVNSGAARAWIVGRIGLPAFKNDEGA